MIDPNQTNPGMLNQFLQTVGERCMQRLARVGKALTIFGAAFAVYRAFLFVKYVDAMISWDMRVWLVPLVAGLVLWITFGSVRQYLYVTVSSGIVTGRDDVLGFYGSRVYYVQISGRNRLGMDRRYWRTCSQTVWLTYRNGDKITFV
jgi:hypothetical protein